MPNGQEHADAEERRILGGSPTDRIIGMLIERTEALRNIHTEMREEIRVLTRLHAETGAAIATLVRQMSDHSATDTENFADIRKSLAAIVPLVQSAGIFRAQVRGGWWVLATMGAALIAVVGVVATIFKH